MQGFHAPDPRDGFDDGGWGHAFADDVQFAAALDLLPHTEAYLFGRRTYEELAQFWPFQPDSNPMAAHLNATPKHVLTSTMNALDWQNSHVLRAPLDTSVAALKREVR